MSQETTKSAPDNQEEKKDKNWLWTLVGSVAGQVVLAILGLVIWNSQNKIEQAVAKNTETLRTQLALKEEFYKRRLTIYEGACKQIADAKAALDEAGATPEYKTRATASMSDLYKLNKVNTLYWSDLVEKRLYRLWELGIEKLRHKRFDDKSFDEQIAKEISALYSQMKEDLKLVEIARIMQEPG